MADKDVSKKIRITYEFPAKFSVEKGDAADPEERRSELLDELERIEEEIEELKEEIEDLEDEIAELEEEKAALKAQLEETDED